MPGQYNQISGHGNGEQIADKVYGRVHKKPESQQVAQERQERMRTLHAANVMLNKRWPTHEFGSRIRFIQEM